MAVTQISRIQVRKGRKLSPTGIPQLAGGEIAWVVDSQELFIGNGSVAEGAPYVGNTKILTEHDNILALISSYKFGGNEPGSPIPFSVERSFQNKLDEYVSVLDFGAVGDGVLDNITAFETAFEQLFQNTIPEYRKVLIVPNGDYVFDQNLRIPSFVQLVGETREGVTLRFTVSGTGLKFVNAIGGAEELNEFTESQRPEHIRISNLTITGNDDNIYSKSSLSGSRFVLFDNVRFRGGYELANPSETPEDLVPAVVWNNSISGLETTDVIFRNCLFENLGVAVRCDQSVLSETQISFDGCNFKNLDTGILVLGVVNQSNKWKIDKCSFINTANHGIYISKGVNTLINECVFEQCGIDLNGDLTVSSVYFGQAKNNIVINCLSNRQTEQLIGTDGQPFTDSIIEQNGQIYVPEVVGADRVEFLNRNQTGIVKRDFPTPFAMLSGLNEYIEIDYFVKLTTGDTRRGKLGITLDKNNELDENEFIKINSLTDDYNYYSVPGRAGARQAGTSLTVYDLEFGQLSVGSVISGEKITPGTKITFIDTFNEPPVHSVDRGLIPPITESTDNQITGAPIFFERNIIKNLIFSARTLDSINNNIVLEYKFENISDEDFSGVISFDISYGTSDI